MINPYRFEGIARSARLSADIVRHKRSLSKDDRADIATVLSECDKALFEALEMVRMAAEWRKYWGVS